MNKTKRKGEGGEQVLEEAAKSFGPMMKLMYNMIGDLSSAFYKKYGKDALPTISSVSAKYGAPNAELVQKMMPIKSMKDVAEMYKMMFGMIGEKFEIVNISDDTLHFKVLNLPNVPAGNEPRAVRSHDEHRQGNGQHSSQQTNQHQRNEVSGSRRQILRSQLFKKVNINENIQIAITDRQPAKNAV